MDYSPTEFLNLIEAVEDTGGKHLRDQPCVPRTITYEIKTKTSKTTRHHVDSTGCGFAARFEVPYSPTEPVEIPLDTAKDAGKLANVKTGEILTQLHMGLDRPSPRAAEALAKADGAGTAVVCAIDDCVGLWPRFRDQTFAEEAI